MINPDTKDIIRIVRTYIHESGESMSEFAEKSDISKSWLSRLKNEDADISLHKAISMLNVAGYKLVVKHQTQITKEDTLPIETLTDEEIKEIDNGKKYKIKKSSRLLKK